MRKEVRLGFLVAWLFVHMIQKQIACVWIRREWFSVFFNEKTSSVFPGKTKRTVYP